MLRKIGLKFLQNKLKKYDKSIEIAVFYDNSLQALKKTQNNSYYVLSMPCKNIFELTKELKKGGINI